MFCRLTQSLAVLEESLVVLEESLAAPGESLAALEELPVVPEDIFAVHIMGQDNSEE